MLKMLEAILAFFGGLRRPAAVLVAPRPPAPVATPPPQRPDIHVPSQHDVARTSAPLSDGAGVTPELLARLGILDAREWAQALAEPCIAHRITTKQRLAHFLANVLHESGDLTRLVENLNYSAEGLLRIWPSHFSATEARRWGRGRDHPADERAIAERAYGGRIGNRTEGSGDGFLYRGRGLIQLTGRANYEAAARALGVALSVLPSWLETREGAARSAAWWWAAHGCNELADRGDIVALRRRVNGGLIGLEDVRNRFTRALAALGD